METLSKTAADATRDKKLRPAPRVSDSVSLSSYKEYPAKSPFINTLLHRRGQTHTHTYRPPSPSKAYPETNSAAILSALRNLQEKIRKLELEKGQADHGTQTMGKDASHTHLHRDRTTQRATEGQRDTRREPESSCNQVLISSLASAESRCAKLERQLDHMRRMLSNAKADKSSLLKQQVSVETARCADQQRDSVSERVQQEKLERLEQEYQRLTRTQTQAEIKIHELELKLQEEEYQRKLVQDKANQLQSGLEANRLLLQSVSPSLATAAPSRDRKSYSKKPVTQPPRSSPRHRLGFKDVPFVAGTSVGCSHSLRANVQSVLSFLKRHQPQLGTEGLLSDYAANEHEQERRPPSRASSPSSCCEELSDLLQALQDELRLMSKEQEQLRKRLEEPLALQERRELHRAQEKLLLKMERKGEQISKLYKHKTQIKKLRREANARRLGRTEERTATPASSRGRQAAAAKLKPGERSRRNLMLLRDIRALQSSLHN